MAVVETVEELVADLHDTVVPDVGCGGPLDDRFLTLKMAASRVSDRRRWDMHRTTIRCPQPVTTLGGWCEVDDTDRAPCLGAHLLDDLGDRGRVGPGDSSGDLFEQLRLSPLCMLRLDRVEHLLDRRSTHRSRRGFTERHLEHPFDVHDAVGTVAPTRTQRRCLQRSVGWLRGASGERDRLVRLADLDR